jgi:hypothetical protein
MADAAEFCLAFRGMVPARTLTAGEAFFLHWPPSKLSARQGPTPTSVGIHYGPSERTTAVFFGSNGPGGSRGSGEQVTPDPTLVAILSLLQRTAAPVSKQRLRAEHTAFSPIGLVAVPICAGPNPLPETQTRRGGDRQRTRQC